MVDYSYSSSFSQPSPTAYVVGFSEAGTSGTKQRKTPRRKRPYISKRKPKPALRPLVMGVAVAEVSKGTRIQVGAMEKRKGVMGDKEEQIAAKRKHKLAVPMEGLSNV